jgi:hypothetical protein
MPQGIGKRDSSPYRQGTKKSRRILPILRDEREEGKIRRL